jgi:hypothetical protein
VSKKLLARPAALALIAANFIPLWGVIFQGWDAANIVHLYWAENVAFGLVTLLRILTNRYPGTGLSGKVFLGGFFTVHYGFFCFGHAMFVFGSAFDMPGPGSAGEHTRLFLKTHWYVVAGFFLSHLISFFLNYHGKGEASRLKPGEVMFLPYRRIFILHFTIIFGGMAVLALGNSASLVAVLVVAKTIGDLILHLREHRGVEAPEH